MPDDDIIPPPCLAERKTPLLGGPPQIRNSPSHTTPSTNPPITSTPRTHNLAATTGLLEFIAPASQPRVQQLRFAPTTITHEHRRTDEIPSTPLAAWQKHPRSGIAYFLAFLVTAAAMVYGVSQKFSQLIDWDVTYQVAFVGNSYLFVNDIPRLLEAMSTGHVYQRSCIHPGGSLSDLWITGNGMYSLWQSEEAMIEYDGGTTYDFGVCTVAQILQGYDEYIAYGNSAGHYYDDGLNPCIVNPYYSAFIEDQLTNDPVKWDYVVLVDQTKRMAIPDARNDTIQVLTNGYAPFLQQSGAIPVIIDTHAFWSDASNMTGLTDVPTFTRYIVQGVQEYTKALRNVLPKRQTPLVAPVGLAYLTIWEENYNLWSKLFMDNRIHASMYGSFLLGLVLYSTIFGHLPADDLYVPFLFEDARYLMGPVAYPDNDEILYMRNVAQRVVLQHHVPEALYGSV